MVIERTANPASTRNALALKYSLGGQGKVEGWGEKCLQTAPGEAEGVEDLWDPARASKDQPWDSS